MPARRHTVCSNNTTVKRSHDMIVVRLHSTDVVIADKKTGYVTYNTGGWKTPTTVRRMQEAAEQFGLPRPPSLREWRQSEDDAIVVPYNAPVAAL